MGKAFENIRLERDGALALVVVDRQDRLNALNTATLVELLAALSDVSADESVRVLILTGAGDRAFVAGADVHEMVDRGYLEALRFAELGQKVCAALEEMPKPCIAAINGYALGGGCELAIACDFAYASTDALIGQPEVNLGIIPGFGGTQRLLRRIPAGLAREMVITGRMLEADEALRVGLVNAVYAPDELLDAAHETARAIAEKGPLAVARAKRLMALGLDLPLGAANALERESFAGLFATEDQTEGMRAFLAKRKPEFRGR
ncbi:MAG: enoyl-CoA hydratase/isomerase family protein [Myxococcales bacterium]|nr:enoyl-CoA hydratase/isomerase family protein [Myxococcales bacterium]